MVIERMKRISSIEAVIACLAFCLFFVVLQFDLSSTATWPTFILTNSLTSQQVLVAETRSWRLKTMSKGVRDRLPPLATISCDRSHQRYDICSINGPAVLDPTISTFFAVGSTSPALIEKIRPYPRKWENYVMDRIKELTLTSGPPSPLCEVQHNVPAVLFSAGGYTGNLFHDFNDGFIPLFVTVNSIFSDDQDFVLVIAKSRDWWLNKYAELISTFSKHPIVNLDNDTATHCFPSVTVGLISHRFATIDPKLLPKKTLHNFRALLEVAYAQNHPSMAHHSPPSSRPRLVLVARSGDVGRVIRNQAEVEQAAKTIGFNVTVFTPTSNTSLVEAYKLINSSHAMIGVHGAALTHLLFLRPGSVFMQVVPIGNEWLAETCYGKPARDLGLEYMEYEIRAEESSLVEKYGKDDMLVKDPIGLQRKDWSMEIMGKYLKEQDVKLNLNRFREYLKNAYDKAKIFMDKEG